jgi:NADPH:quinone reductase-like Zn-dependent oxidoreductase
MLWTSLFKNIRKTAHFAPTGLLPPAELKAMLVQLLPMIEQEKLTPVIDRSYSLDDISVAHQYVDTGRKKGNGVIQLA